MQVNNSNDKQQFIYSLIEEYEKSVFGVDDKLSVLDKLTLDLVKYKANQLKVETKTSDNNKKKIIPLDLSSNSN